MRRIIVKLGHIRSVIVISVVSSLASVFITLFMLHIYALNGVSLNIATHLTIASVVPLLLAPPISWVVIGLLLKIDQLEIEMRKAATFDPLTGLYNRYAFMERANIVLNLAKRENFDISVLLVDLDHFKSINDKFGHAVGDKALAAFGKAVTQIARKSDIVARLGGEEFVFFLPAASREQAWTFSHRLHETAKNIRVDHAGVEIRITLSAGIVTLPHESDVDLERLLSLADHAMYRAKDNGRNQSVIYHEGQQLVAAG